MTLRESMFQLGHVLSDMDSLPASFYFRDGTGFQLGHVLSDMDSGLELYELADFECFNWATSFQTWIDNIGACITHSRHRFNWATSFQTWIVDGDGRDRGARARVSIGPRPFRHG